MRVGRRLSGAIILVLVLLSALPAISAAPPVATILTTTETNTVRKQGAKASTSLANRAALYPGDIVSTGKKGKCSLLFGDGSQIRLNGNSRIELTVSSGAKDKKSLFRVVWGEVWVRLRPGREVVTRSAVAGARGTEFALAVDESQTTTLTVVDGEVDFYNEYGSVLALESQQSTARPGSAPTIPVTVDNANFIIEWTLDLERAAVPRERPNSTAAASELDSRVNKARALVDAHPEDVTARLDYGAALLDRGRPEEALAQFRESDRMQPDQAVTLTGIGDALLELGRLDESADSFDKALSKSPGYAPALVGRAYIELRRSAPSAAEGFARQAVAAARDSAEPHITLGVALLRQPEKTDEGKTALEASLSAGPAQYHYQAHAWLAMYWLAKTDVKRAVTEGETARQANGGSALAHGNLALVYLFAGRGKDAVREARAASALNPPSVAAQVALAQSLLTEGRVDSASRAAAQAAALDPALPEAHYVLGVADAQRRDYTHAARSLRECLRLAPDFMPAVSALARVYIKMGRENDAEAVLQAVEARNPNHPETLSALGAVHYAQARYASALALYDKAIGQSPNVARYYAEKAMVALDSNLLGEAIRTAQKAVQLSPQTGAFHAILGLAYDYSLMEIQAEREFRTALALDPENALALVELGLRNRDGDPRTSQRTAGIAFVQGFLYDPSISERLLRGGVTDEIQGRGGEEAGGATLVQRLQSDDSRSHSYIRGNRQRDEGALDHSESTLTSGRLDTTFEPTPGAAVYVHGLLRRDEADLPGGGEYPGELDDSAKGRFGEGILASRLRIGDVNHLWLGLFKNGQSISRDNPDRNPSMVLQGMNWFGQAITVTEQKNQNWALNPEIRADLALGRSRRRPLVLSLGAARLTTRDNLQSSLFIEGVWLEDGSKLPDDTGVLTDRRAFRSNLAYLQLAGRPSERFWFTTQLRRQSRKIATSRDFGWISGDNFWFIDWSDPPTQSRTYWLPSLVANYVANQRTLLRLYASRRLTDVTSSIFAPTETLLTTEASILPAGLPETSDVLELDVERYCGPGRVAKFFMFHSTARNVQYDISSYSNLLSFCLGNLRRYGAGLRFETPLAGSAFGHIGTVWSRTVGHLTVDGFPAAWDGKQAPYQPVWTADAGLNYISTSGLKASLLAAWTGPFYQDYFIYEPRPQFPARTRLDAAISWEPTIHSELTVGVTNLLDTRLIVFNGIELPGRRYYATWTGRF